MPVECSQELCTIDYRRRRVHFGEKRIYQVLLKLPGREIECTFGFKVFHVCGIDIGYLELQFNG
jgi:hypothetical protein